MIIQQILVMKGPQEPYRDAQQVQLDASGIIGDVHDNITLAAAEHWEEIQSFDGLCTGRFNANLLTEGLDYSELTAGIILSAGSVSLKITRLGKRCFSACSSYAHPEACPLKRNCAFAEVLEGGTLEAGQTIVRELYEDHRVIERSR